MAQRQWQPIVSDFSRVMKLVHLAMRMDQSDVQALAVELFNEKRQAYKDALEVEAANVGCAGRKAVVPQDRMAEMREEANTEAAGIINTYNYDLALAVRSIRAETATANRNVYAKRLADWEASRNEWKSKQIALWNIVKWADTAQADFLNYNRDIIGEGGYAIVEPQNTAVCAICQYWVKQGKVKIDETRRQQWPAHLNCPHHWVYHYRKVKVDCAELWVGAPISAWYDELEVTS